MYPYKKIKLKDGSTKDEHRIVMERVLGRKLLYDEVVHHIDGNKRNNNPENLQILSHEEHIALHKSNGDIRMRDKISEKEKINLCKYWSEIDEEMAIYIIKSNKKACDLCKELNVSKFVISRIRTGKSWKHLSRKND